MMADRIDYSKTDGNLDDVVVENVEMFRLEYMSDKSIWIKLYKKDGSEVVINLSSDSKINGSHHSE